MRHRPISLFTGPKAILQTNAAVKDQVAGLAVLAVGAEITQSHELIGGGGLCILQAGFYLAAGEDFQRIGI